MSSPLKRLTRKVFERHSNPWSAWTRLLSIPLVLVPFWTRSPKYALLVGGWMLLNPVVFPRPEDDSAWVTKAMLGEELWIAERPVDGAMAINVVAATFGIGGVVASLKRKLAPTALCTVAEITLLLVHWRLMVDYYEEHRQQGGAARLRQCGVITPDDAAYNEARTVFYGGIDRRPRTACSGLIEWGLAALG